MINRLTKYIILEQIKPFTFFLGVMAGIIWLVKSIPSLEYVIEYNQPIEVFIQVVLFILPTVLLIVIPFAALAATSFIMNRLLSEAELITIMNSGLSNFQLLRPFFLFSSLISMFLIILIFYAAPMSQRHLRIIMHEAGNNVYKQMMQIRKFYSPSPNINVYIGGLSDIGELERILITDDRDESLSITYSANTGSMIIEENNIELFLNSGTIQNYNKIDDSLVLTNFNFLRLNISNPFTARQSLIFGPSEMSPIQMLTKAVFLEPNSAKKYIGEAHLRIILIFTPISMCVFSFSAFVVRGYSRRGYSLLIFGIFAYGAFIHTLTFATKSLYMSGNIHLSVIYLPTTLTLLFSILAIAWSSHHLKPISTRTLKT